MLLYLKTFANLDSFEKSTSKNIQTLIL